MGLSEYTFRLMLLFFPGIIAFIIVDMSWSSKIVTHRSHGLTMKT